MQLENPTEKNKTRKKCRVGAGADPEGLELWENSRKGFSGMNGNGNRNGEKTFHNGSWKTQIQVFESRPLETEPQAKAGLLETKLGL